MELSLDQPPPRKPQEYVLEPRLPVDCVLDLHPGGAYFLHKRISVRGEFEERLSTALDGIRGGLVDRAYSLDGL